MMLDGRELAVMFAREQRKTPVEMQRREQGNHNGTYTFGYGSEPICRIRRSRSSSRELHRRRSFSRDPDENMSRRRIHFRQSTHEQATAREMSSESRNFKLRKEEEET